MGEANLAKLPSPPTEVKSSTDHINVLHDALYGNLVMRDSSGVVTDGAGDIGRPSAGRPENIYVKNSIILGGSIVQEEDVGKQKNVILSGKAKTSGYPDFLSVGVSNKVSILAATTNLEMNINGALYTLSTDRETASLALAPSTNNTALVSDVNASGQQWTRTTGEYGWQIPIDNVGSEISAISGEIGVVKVGNEYMLGLITGGQVSPYIRGIGGTRSAAYSDNDTVTLMKAHYIFLNKDMVTISTTTTFPRKTGTQPTSYPTPSSGDYWYDTINNTWKKYNGVAWDVVDDIFLGIGICDSAGLVAVEPNDFYIDWKEDFDCGYFYRLSNTRMRPWQFRKIGIKNKVVEITQQNLTALNNDADITTMLEPGLTEQASTWYYIYFDLENFTFVLTDEAPRHPGYNGRRGYYHPREYWRCVAFAYNNSSMNFVETIYYPKSGKLYAGNNAFVFSTVPSINTFYFSSGLPSVVSVINVTENLQSSSISLGAPVYFYSQYGSLEQPSFAMKGSTILWTCSSGVTLNFSEDHTMEAVATSGLVKLIVTQASSNSLLNVAVTSGTFFL